MKRLLSKALRRPQAKIQLLSDLHLEIGQQYASFAGFPQTAPYLLLAGDVGRLADYTAYAAFLEAQAARYDKVLIVLGNHEFWGMSYAAALDAARRMCAEPALRGRVELLHRRRWDCPRSRLSVLGCTLWSRIPEDKEEVVRGKVKDFVRIEGWTTREHVRRHEEDLAWLRAEVGRIRAEKGQDGEGERREVVVATHHAPTKEGTSRAKDAENPWSVAFASELFGNDGEGGWEPVRAWAYGHTHFCTSFERDGVRIVANQRGYVLPGTEAAQMEGRVWKREVKVVRGEFDPGFTIELD